MTDYLTFILKNTSTSQLVISNMGLTIDALASVEISKSDMQLANSCADLMSYISSGKIVLNNGVKDLSSSEAFLFLNNELDYSGMYSQIAHTHTKSQISDFAHGHNDLYYTTSQIDSMKSSLNYSAISAIDGTTNVTGVELEKLTNGSNADGLHTHEFPNYTNLTLDESYDHSNGVSRINVDSGYILLYASNGWAPLELHNLDYTPNQGLCGGQMCTRDNILYVYDDVRCKWLSVEGYSFQSFSTSSAAWGYMSHGNTMNAAYGFTMPFKGTITSMSMSTQNHGCYGRLTVRINGNDAGADLWFCGEAEHDDTINVDFESGDTLETYIDQVYTKPRYPSAVFLVKRRI